MEMVTKVNPKLSSCCCCRFLEQLRRQTLRRTRLQNSVELPKDTKKSLKGFRGLLVTTNMSRK